jgi:hypothetical protein
MARKIDTGAFMVTGQSHVIIDRNGNLLNGQHTLLGVVLSKKPIVTIVSRNIDPDAFPAIDIGHKRTNGQMFAVMGVKNGRAMGATIRTVEMLKQYRAGNASAHRLPMDNDTARDIYGLNPDLWDEIVASAENLRRLATKEGLRVASSPIGAFIYEAVEVGVPLDDAVDFCQRVISLDGHTADTPRASLRRWLAGTGLIKKASGSNQQVNTAVVFIKTWNAEITGTSLRKIYGWSGSSTDIPRVTPRP